MRTRLALVCDSTADLPPPVANQQGISVVPLTVIVDNSPLLDGVEIGPAEFYRRLAAERPRVSTSQPSAERFGAVYRSLLQDHDEVLSLHISSRLSGTYDSALRAASEFQPGRVTVVDTKLVSMPLALLVLAARRLAETTPDTSALLARLEPIRQAIGVHFMVATLEYLRRGGRVGRAASILGEALQVKPLLTIDEGEVAPLERVRTAQRAERRLTELALQASGPGEVCAIVGHAAAEAAAGRLADSLRARAETLLVVPLGPVVGAHAGPGTLGVGCYPARLMPLGLGHLTGAGTR